MEQKGSTNIQVAIRIRPLIAIEEERKLRPQWSTQNNIIYQIDEHAQKFGEPYSFDHIFDMNKTNLEIYDEIVKDFVVSSLDGLNSTIFAYGQTSSGKTYTMLGDKKDTGVMSLAIENIFNIIQNNSSRKYLLRVSYMEIYNEKINDLLDPTNKDVKIREFFPAIIGLQNIKEEIVSNKEQMYDCLKRGNLNRHIGSTKANERSSRSHTIFKIMIESTQVSDFNDSGGCVQVSNINLVDLAGSERVAQTKATGMRLKEGGHINKSLSALGLVIRQLSDGQEFVSFRDSKLTRLLQDSLGGNSKTLIIATITLASIEDTCSTLAFAQRAKAVKNKPHVNEILTDADVSKRYAALNTQLQRKLEEQLTINQRLQQTHEENIREMTRLHQQMEMLEDFQGKRVTKEINTPKRRHTIGFSAHKKMLPTTSEMDFERSTQNLQDIKHFEDLLTKQSSRCVSTLETIMEEDPTPLNNKSTPEKLLRTRLSALEEEYNELVTYTRDENNILNETTKKAEKLEVQLQTAQKKILEYQNDQKLEKELLKGKFKKRELDLCTRIRELEEEMQKKPEKIDYGINNGNITHIMDQLICLQDILNSSDLFNDVEETKEEDSVLQIIEKFNLKVKTSKDMIEEEILKQINNFDHNLQEEIILPNELASFNDLLNELSLFETDIPVALINNMKNEGVEDLKILIKVYESLLRKNELLGRCSEKIKFLEDQRVKNEVNNNELKNELLEKTKLISETQQNYEVAVKQELENKIKENTDLLEQVDRLKSIVETYTSELDNLKINTDKLMQEVSKKNQENERLTEECSSVNCKYKSLKDENELIKSDKDSNCKKLEDYRNQISHLSSFKQEVEAKTKEIQNLLEHVENLKTMIDSHKSETDDLKLNSNQLLQEITEKDRIILESENRYATIKEESDKLKKEFSTINFENNSLKNKLENASLTSTEEVEKLQKEHCDICLEKLVENVKLVESNEFYRKELNELKNRLSKLHLEIRDKDEILAETQKDCLLFKQEKENLLQQITNIDNNKESLSEEIEHMKNIIESQNKKLKEVEKNCSLLKEEKERLNHEFSNIYSENQSLKKEVEKTKDDGESCNKRISSFQSEISKLTSEILRKNVHVSELEQNWSVQKQEIDKLKQETSSLLAENKTLKHEMNSLKKFADLNDKLSLEITEKDKIVCELKHSNAELKLQVDNAKQKSENVLSENEHLRIEIRKLKTLTQDCDKNGVDGQRFNPSDLRVQRLKQLLNNAQTEISDLKLGLKDKEKLKCEISQYKCQLLLSKVKQEELMKMTEQLRVQISEQEEKNEKHFSSDVAKEQEKCVELRCIKKKFEDVLCSIIEHFVNEQKTMLLTRHSQDQRDYFKSILRDLKSSNVILKDQLNLLRNQSNYDLSAITTNLLKSRHIFKEYFSLEKSLMQKNSDQLDASNKAYLQEIMAIREAQQDFNNKNECPYCKSANAELSKLSTVAKLQEEMLNSLKNKNTLLGKENIGRMKQIVNLQVKMYEEQDRKADVQYTDWLKFCQENDKMQQQQIHNLQQKIGQYENATMRNQQSVEVQCDIVQMESSMQEKYNAMKNVCILRKQKIALLESEIKTLRISPELEEKCSVGDMSVKTACAEVQCDIISLEKYVLTKKVCQSRREEIVSLQNELTALKAGSK